MKMEDDITLHPRYNEIAPELSAVLLCVLRSGFLPQKSRMKIGSQKWQRSASKEGLKEGGAIRTLLPRYLYN